MIVSGSVIKKAKVQGKEHINYRGQPVEARKTGINCSCWKHSFGGTDKVCQANMLKFMWVSHFQKTEGGSNLLWMPYLVLILIRLTPI
jgi:hypothetical protein